MGAGIYVVIGFTARDIAGPAIVLSYGIAGIAALASGLSFAQLSKHVHTSGGAFEYSTAVFGELVGWLVGWSTVLEITLSSSAVSRGMRGYLLGGSEGAVDGTATSLSSVLSTSMFDPVALLLIGLLCAFLCVGIRESARFNMAVCSINMSCILYGRCIHRHIHARIHVFLSVYLPTCLSVCLRPSHTTRPRPRPRNAVVLSSMSGWQLANLVPSQGFAPYGMSGVFSAAGIVFFSFIGFDYIPNAAEEATNPTRDVPRSIVTSLLVASVLYMGMACSMVLMQPYQDINIYAPYKAAFLAQGKRVAASVVSAGAICGTSSQPFRAIAYHSIPYHTIPNRPPDSPRFSFLPCPPQGSRRRP